MSKDVDYPETWGSKVARENRVWCNRMSYKEREQLIAEAMAIINAPAQQPKPPQPPPLPPPHDR